MIDSRTAGVTALELVAVLTLVAILLAITLPALAEASADARLRAGARGMAMLLHGARWRSISSSRGAGFVFSMDARGWSWQQVEDGNGNGVRVAEVRNGVDPVIFPERRLEALAPGVRLGFPPGGTFPGLPSGGAAIRPSNDPVRFGSADLIAFTPLGTSSSGTLYVTDGNGLAAIVLYGRSSRIRVWSYDPRRQRWRL